MEKRPTVMLQAKTKNEANDSYCLQRCSLQYNVIIISYKIKVAIVITELANLMLY